MDQPDNCHDVRYLKQFKIEETETELLIQGQVRDPDDLWRFMKDLQDDGVSKMIGVHLDENNLFLGHQVFIGMTAKNFDPHSFWRYYLLFSADKFTIMTNHPSGDVTPTDADRALMRKLTADAQTLSFDPVFEDYIITGKKNYFSMATNDGTACRCGHQEYIEAI